MSEANLSERARELANELFKVAEGGPYECCQPPGTSCLMKEEERPLTRQEKYNGWARRPFWAYDTQKLCNACRAYWCVEMAAQDLHRLECLRARAEALAAREGGEAHVG
jgi:hypothetical protein